MRRAVTFAQEIEQILRQPVLLRGEDNVWFAIVFDQSGARHPFRHHMARRLDRNGLVRRAVDDQRHFGSASVTRDGRKTVGPARFPLPATVRGAFRIDRFTKDIGSRVIRT